MSHSSVVAPLSVRAEVCSDIELKVATSRHERQEAFELTYNSYLRAGLCAEHESRMRATDHQLLPTTDVIIAKLRGEVISTMSLVRDGSLGLPMEGVYPDIVAARRAAGKRIAEVSCLADRRTDPGRFMQLFNETSRLTAQLARQLGVDELLVVVHPRHAALYRRYLAFQQIGNRRDYATVCDNPAVALLLNFADAEANSHKNWLTLFGNPLPSDVLRSSPLSDADVAYFRSVLAPESDRVPFPAAGGDWDTDTPTDAQQLLCA